MKWNKSTKSTVLRVLFDVVFDVDEPNRVPISFDWASCLVI